MKVFNLYLKIIKNNLPLLVIYVFIFLTMAIVLTLTSSPNAESTSFTQVKTKIAFFDEDQTFLTENFRKNMEKIADIIPIENEENSLKDAMFFKKINAIVTIEKGFTEKMLAGIKSDISVNMLPNSYDSQYLEIAINNYFNTLKSYISTNNGTLSEEKILEFVNKDLEKTVAVEFVKEETPWYLSASNTYFNYLSYVLFAVVIMGVSFTMSTINEIKMRRRILCAPISNTKLNGEIILGHIIYSTAIIVLLLLAGMCLFPKLWTDFHTILWVLNGFCITITALGISYFIGTVIKSKDVQSAIANVLSLGMCFISGVFVPLEMLGESVLTIASFTPVYWYVQANSSILNMNSLSEIQTILPNLAIELGFGIAFILLAITISKKRRTSEK